MLKDNKHKPSTSTVCHIVECIRLSPAVVIGLCRAPTNKRVNDSKNKCVVVEDKIYDIAAADSLDLLYM